MKVLFTICGRGGSKGVKNKNIRLFLGAPLIRYSLVDAFLAFNDDKIIEKQILVDSDSDDILNTAKAFLPCIYVHKREQCFAGDKVAKNQAIAAALADYEKERGQVDCVIDLDITSPLRTLNDIERTFQVFSQGKNDVVYTVVEARRNPYFNMVERIDGHTQLCKPSNYTCRQDAPSVYEMNASIYAYKTKALYDTKPIFHCVTDCVVMKDYGVLDIDHEDDFTLMQLIYTKIAEPDDKYYVKKYSLAQRKVLQ